jgi:hypothetical protein
MISHCSQVGWEDWEQELEASRGGSNGLRHLEFCSGLLSNRWHAVVSPSGVQRPPKVFQSPCKRQATQQQRIPTICSSRLQLSNTENI